MNKKVVALVLACVLIFSTIVAGTLAWLQTQTGTVTNTFTFGNIDLTLAETVSPSFEVVPGTTATKDPKVTVGADSEDCFVYIKVEENGTATVDGAEKTLGDYVGYTIDSTNWKQLKNGDEEVSGIYYYKYTNQSEAKELGVLTDNTVTFADTITKDMIDAINDADAGDQLKLSFTAYAVQKEAAGEATDDDAQAYAAWIATFGA